MSDYLKDTTPLGKSVEEIEGETQNTTSSPVPGEERQDDGGVPLALPATTVAGLGAGSGAMVGGALVGVGGTGEAEAGPRNDGRADDPTDSGQA